MLLYHVAYTHIYIYREREMEGDGWVLIILLLSYSSSFKGEIKDESLFVHMMAGSN